MRLLICTQSVDKNDPILGFFHRWIEEFAKHFEHIYVICLNKGEYSLPPNVSVYSLGKETGGNRIMYLVRFYRFFSKIFFATKVDFVFFHMGAIYNILSAPFFLIRKLFGTKFYWWKTHGHINGMGKIASVFTDRIYTASKESFPLNVKKRIIVGHAVDTNTFNFKPAELLHTVQILCVGRISKVKNIEVVIDVARLLKAKNILFHVDIVGITIDQEYQKLLNEQIERYDLTKEVIFIGPKKLPELIGHYHTGHILLNPSKTGSIDKVVLEAMSCGVVPIAPCGAYSTVLGDYRLCVKNNTAEEYVSIIENLIAKKDERYTLTGELRKDVTNNHTLETLTNRIFYG